MSEWKCKLCAYDSERSSDLITHYTTIHVPQCRTIHLPCIFASCVEISPSYTAWNKHRSICHSFGSSSRANHSFRCSVSDCDLTFVSANDLLKHIRTGHLNYNQTVVCPFRGCEYATNVTQNFRTHQSRCHSRYDPLRAIKSIVFNSFPSQSTDQVPSPPSNVTIDVPFDEEMDTGHSQSENENGCDIDDIIFRKLINFFLQLQILDLISFDTIQRIVDEITVFL